MAALLKVLLMIITVQLYRVNGNPLFQGISFQRGFEINFKPLPWRPISFIKEKWSPLGVFGKKFAIQKRSLDDMVPLPPPRGPRPAAPVFEHIDEIEPIDAAPILILPKPVVKPTIPPPPVSPSEPLPVPLPPQLPIILNEISPLPDKRHATPSITTDMVIIQPTKIINNHVSTRGLYTDITRLETIKDNIHTVEHIYPPSDVSVPQESVTPISVVPIPVIPVETSSPSVESKPPVSSESSASSQAVSTEVEKNEASSTPVPSEVSNTGFSLKDSSFIRGSKMALQFGTVFLTLMAQFFDSARATIDLMTNPPPKFNS